MSRICKKHDKIITESIGMCSSCHRDYLILSRTEGIYAVIKKAKEEQEREDFARLEYKEIEYLLDKANGEHGTKESLCLFCNAKKYDSKVGIIHKPLCIIMRLREEIKND